MRIFFVLCLTSIAALFSDEYYFIGKHYLSSFYGCCVEKLLDTDQLVKTMHVASTEAGATVLGEQFFVFPGGGLTLVLMLSESHASIHTYPEYGACFVDFFTCGNACKPDVFEQMLKHFLQPATVNSSIITRD